MSDKNPPADFRPVPFWSWNDRLDIPELRRQIREMHAAGIGGFFMHARSGLRTRYFSGEWFEAVKACIEEAAKLGMEPWLYDENGWPSGFGNGGVNGLGEKYRQKYLRMTKGEAPRNPICRVGEMSFYYDVNPYYVDTLDASVTAEFIRQVYQVYRDTLPPEIWRSVKGFFTDEPQISRDGIPWSLTLPGEYEKAYGRDLFADLPGLFAEVPGYRSIRVRYWGLVTRLFMDHFLKPVHDWCDANGVLLTGHHVLEETYHSQLTTNGAIMPQYQYYHIPGVDWLGRRTPSAVALIQLLSVAAQTGKKRLLVETFACCGWNVSFQDLKWLYQLQMVRGMNFLCQHLEGYSLRGLRKRDYPASLFLHQPWWSEYHHYNDYVSRIGRLLAEGEVECPVLVLHGQSTAWIEYNDGDNGVLNFYSDAFAALTRELEMRQINCHYGDETLIGQYGSVNGRDFVIGKQRYRIVVLPQLSNISLKEKTLLLDFCANGGILVGVRDSQGHPFTVDGEADPEITSLLEKCRWFASEAELAEHLRGKYSLCRIDGEAKEIVCAKRRFANWEGAPADLFYLVNQSNSESAQVRVEFNGRVISSFDAASGEFLPFPACASVLEHDFEPGGDLLVMVRPRDGEPARSKTLEPAFELKLLTPNTLTLDTCRCCADGELLAEKIETISLMPELLKLERPAEVRLEFTFEIDPAFNTARPLHLVIENPEQYRIFLNDSPVDAKTDGTLFDHAFKTIPLPPCRKGENRIRLETHFEQDPEVYEMLRRGRCCESEGNKITFDMELESIYIAGDFAVRNQGSIESLPKNAERVSGPFVITEPAAVVTGANLQRDGLCFFAGRALLTQHFDLDRTDYSVLSCSELFANAAGIRLNGRELGIMLWRPYRVAVPAGLLKEKDNLLEIELAGNLRNLLGPHHLAEGESFGVGPYSFFRHEDYLGHQPLPWNEDYCIVRFGLETLSLS